MASGQDTGKATSQTGIYVMSVAARLCGMHPQTLRKYERAGLIAPSRVSGQRLYSDKDMLRLRTIKRLVDGVGLNLAGVELALRFQDRASRLADTVEKAEMDSGQKWRVKQEIAAMLDMLQSG